MLFYYYFSIKKLLIIKISEKFVSAVKSSERTSIEVFSNDSKKIHDFKIITKNVAHNWTQSLT